MKVRARIAAAGFALALGLVGCGSSDSSDLPAADTLLPKAVESTSKIQTAHFVIGVEGDNIPPNLTVRAIDGDIDRAGRATGFIHIDNGGITFEGDFVITEDKGYYKGVTGGWQVKPIGAMKLLYDSSLILDPERGVAKMLASTTEAQTTAKEEVEGIETFKVTGQTPGHIVARVVPGVAGKSVTVHYWVETAEPHRMVRAVIEQPDGVTVSANLTKPDVPITVTAPQ